MQVRIGNKLVEAELNAAGVPMIKARCETIKHADGTQDVIVHVPCLEIQGKKE